MYWKKTIVLQFVIKKTSLTTLFQVWHKDAKKYREKKDKQVK